MSNTLILFIVDESGSMGSMRSDVIGGFNTFIADQKQIKNDMARLYLVKFNNVVTVVHNGIGLDTVPQLMEHNYTPNGGTALYDAIAHGVRVAERDKTPEERVICVIMTDGQENTSRKTTLQQVKDIITGHEAKGDWTFLYIGENPEQWAQSSGTSSTNTARYEHRSPRDNFMRAHCAVSGFRSSESRQDSDLLSVKDSEQQLN